MLSWGLFPRTYAPTQACTVLGYPGVPSGTQPSQPFLSAATLHPVFLEPFPQLQPPSPSLTGPTCRRGPVPSSFLAAEPVFP